MQYNQFQTYSTEHTFDRATSCWENVWLPDDGLH